MNRIVRRPARRRRAFTLLEVLMVIVIIGILAAFVVPNLFGVQGKAQKDMTRSLIKSGINGALDLYRLHMGKYPDSLEDLYTQPDDEELADKWVGYVKGPKELRDAWGQELIYEFPGQYNETGYDLSSPGANGQAGDEDDITNWEKT